MELSISIRWRWLSFLNHRVINFASKRKRLLSRQSQPIQSAPNLIQEIPFQISFFGNTLCKKFSNILFFWSHQRNSFSNLFFKNFVQEPAFPFLPSSCLTKQCWDFWVRQQIQQKSLNFQTIPKNFRAEEKSISNISLRPICWVLAHLEILRAFKGVQTEEKNLSWIAGLIFERIWCNCTQEFGLLALQWITPRRLWCN